MLMVQRFSCCLCFISAFLISQVVLVSAASCFCFLGFATVTLGSVPTSRGAGLYMLPSNKAYAVLLGVARILSGGTGPFYISVSSV